MNSVVIGWLLLAGASRALQIPGLNTCSNGRDTYCRQCSASSGCLMCVGSYPVAGTCVAVPSTLQTTCKTFLSASVCSSCVTGYFLSGNTCKPLPANCSRSDSSGFCSACKEGYALTASKTCEASTLPAASNCIEQGAVCYQCKSGYVLFNGGCQPMASQLSGCQSLRNNNMNMCEVCNDGYYMNYSSGTCSYSSNASAGAEVWAAAVVFALVSLLV